MDRQVSASTQNQALAALLFLYQKVLQVELPGLDGVERTEQSRCPSVVLTPGEVKHILSRQQCEYWLIGSVRGHVKSALKATGIAKPASCHTLRRGLARHLLESGYDICTVQEPLGHKGVETTQICTQHAQGRKCRAEPAGSRSR